MYVPACFMCKHVKQGDNGPSCSAFPTGIPRKYLTMPHTTVVPEQTGRDIYEPADEDSPRIDELVNIGPDSM